MNRDCFAMTSPRFGSLAFKALLTCGLMAIVMACSCITSPPLSECDVRERQAALLVEVKCRKTIQCSLIGGTGVSDVEIVLVLDDKTDLNLAEGEVVSVESSLDGGRCGFSLDVGSKYILFAGQTAIVARNATTTSSDVDIELAPAEDVVCHTFDAPLTTGSCLGNIKNPTEEQIAELMGGCHR